MLPKMNRILLASVGILASAGIASAQTATTTMTTATAAPAPEQGFSAGDVVVRFAFSGIQPLKSSSHIDGIGGKVDVTGGVQPEVDLSYFVTDNISLQLIATATRHEISANNTVLAGPPYNLGHKIDLASTYVLPPAITAQYHFLPHAAFDPYAGLGVDFLFPFDTQENQATLGGTQIVQKVGLSNAIGPVFNVGVDYNISGPWFVNLDYKQVLNQVTARVTTALGEVKARVDLNPSVFSAGIAYRF